MSRLDKIRSMNDDELIAFLRKYRNEKQACKRCAKEGANCNPYTGADCIDIGVYEWIDPDTQVHYIYNRMGGVSVRYNADGTIMHD